MSISTLYDVFCDLCGNWIGSEKSARLARQHATRHGWIRVKDGVRGSLVDLCPNCAKKREATKVV